MLILKKIHPILALILLFPPLPSFGSSALWRVVNNLCVFNYQRLGTAFPCERIYLEDGRAKGYAIVRDPETRYHYLLVPTLKLKGVESPELLSPSLPDYFSLAWQNRDVLDSVNGKPLPRNAFALTINSQRGRTQGQLHIHIACLKPHIRLSIDRQLPHIGNDWTALPENLVGQHYVGKRIRQDNLEGVYPFVQIGRQLAKSSVEMKNFGVAVVPVTFEDKQQGFVLLADEAGRVKNNTGHTENMLDFTCKGFVN